MKAAKFALVKLEPRLTVVLKFPRLCRNAARPLARAHPDILCAIITDGCQGAAVSSKLSSGMLFAFVIYPIGDVKLDEPTLTLAYLCILYIVLC